MTSPLEIAAECVRRAAEDNWRLQLYDRYLAEYQGTERERVLGGVRGSYADGRPALQDLSEFRTKLQARPGAPNWIKPIIDDRVAVSSPLPTITFDPKSQSPEDEQQAVLCSRVVRGQYELSQMDVGQTHATFFTTLFGEVCYTLDPLRPKDVEKLKDPFALPGVYINVQDPRYCFPRFGTGREANRLQDLFLYYRDVPKDKAEALYPDVVGKLQGRMDRVDIVVWYTRDSKITVVHQGNNAVEVFREDHHYGFCPAEWAINRTTGIQYGTSEVAQTVHVHRNAQALFHLALDGAILATFPPIHVHNPEHVGRMRYGPLAIIETVEDGTVQPLASTVNPQVPTMLLDMVQSNILKQTGTSPIRQDMDIRHANTSGRALQGAQGPMEARLAMSNTLLGSALQWVNSKIAIILYTDKDFRTEEMSVYGMSRQYQHIFPWVRRSEQQHQAVTFKGEDLGGLWRNHVRWPALLGGNEHEQMVMYLQLFKDGLVSGRKVLEAIGEDDPEALIEEARVDQQQRAQPQAPGQNPTQAAEANVALGKGAMPGGPALPPGQGGPPPGTQPPPGPPGGGGGMPGFSSLASNPTSPPGGSSPVPDIWGAVQQAIGTLNLKGEVVGAIGTKGGIRVTVTDHRDVAMLKTALKPVAESVAGPGAKVDVTVQPK